MNWMGGARNRIKLQEEKKRQQEFFSKRRQNNQSDFGKINANENNKKVCSQDLLLFETIDKIFNDTQPKIPKDPKKKVLHVELKERNVKFNTSKLPISPSYFPSVINLSSDNDCVKSNRPQLQITNTHLQNWCVKLSDHFKKDNSSKEHVEDKKQNDEFQSNNSSPKMRNRPSEQEFEVRNENQEQETTKKEQAETTWPPGNQDQQRELLYIKNLVNYQAGTSQQCTSVQNTTMGKVCPDDVPPSITKRPKINFVESESDRSSDGTVEHYHKTKSPFKKTESSAECKPAENTNEQGDTSNKIVSNKDKKATPDVTGYLRDYALWQKQLKNEMCHQLEYEPICIVHESEKDSILLSSTSSGASSTLSSQGITFSNKKDCYDEIPVTNNECTPEESLHHTVRANLHLIDMGIQTEAILLHPVTTDKFEMGVQTDHCCTCYKLEMPVDEDCK